MAAIGSSPEKALARSLAPHALPRASRTATSFSESILLTVSGEVSDSTSSLPVRSCQNGMLILVPPVWPRTFRPSTVAMMPA
ncbi:hypothetical protein D9M71_770350 [compost metagenome]